MPQVCVFACVCVCVLCVCVCCVCVCVHARVLHCTTCAPTASSYVHYVYYTGLILGIIGCEKN